jgi:hypothetical protein
MARTRKSQPDDRSRADGRRKTGPPAVEEDVAEPASPPCLMHEVDPAYMGLGAEATPTARAQGKRRVS